MNRKRFHNPVWLLDDIVTELSVNAKQPKDVRWVGSYDGMMAISWDEFALIAAQFDVTYADDVPPDLVIVGDDWWLEYDALHDWVFQTKPARRPDAASFTGLTDGARLSNEPHGREADN